MTDLPTVQQQLFDEICAAWRDEAATSDLATRLANLYLAAEDVRADASEGVTIPSDGLTQATADLAAALDALGY